MGSPYRVRFTSARQRLAARLAQRASATPPTWVPPGHFYSPICDPALLAARRDRIFSNDLPMPDIDLAEADQLALLPVLGRHAHALDFPDHPPDSPPAARPPGQRYHYQNPAFSYGDAAVLATLMLETRPKRIVEVGSGYSSCLMLDINDRHFGGAIDCTFVEPYPDLLHRLTGDAPLKLIPRPIQEVDAAIVDDLEAGDILFIDSTHVVKCDSDVNHHVFRIFPRLKPGVLIHLHDIFWPFEYPQEWFFGENRSWTENYLLRAFLMHNDAYRIVFFNGFMHARHAATVEANLPGFLRNSGGSFWMRKLR